MGKGRVIFIKNAALLTATSLILRFVGMLFRVWLASSVGAEGMGLYQQIFSVYAFVSVFATSGIGIAVTRLVSEEIALGCRRGVEKVLFKSIIVVLVIAAVSGSAVYGFAKPISVYIISDTRAISALKIMSFSLPFMAVSAVFKGYFFARKKALPNSSSQLIEQGVRIAFIMGILRSDNIGVAESCAAVLFGDAVAEFSSFAYLSLVYVFDRKKLSGLSGRKNPDYRFLPTVSRIAAPIALGKYLNSFLRTVENMIVPTTLVKSGLTRADALSKFGMIKGMALPLLFFPAGLLSSVTSLLIPEMSEAAVRGKRLRIKYAAERSLTVTFLASIPFAVGFFFAAEPLGRLIYKEDGVGGIIKALAPLVPFMYIDSVSDALLKALDKQMVTFRHSILDSLGRIVAILAFLPFFSFNGFIVIMYASNLFTSLLNLTCLIKTSGAQMTLFKDLFMPLTASVLAALLADTLLGFFASSDLVYIILLFGCIFITFVPTVILIRKR